MLEWIYLVGKQNYKKNKKVKGAILRMDKDSKIRYNYLQLAVT